VKILTAKRSYFAPLYCASQCMVALSDWRTSIQPVMFTEFVMSMFLHFNVYGNDGDGNKLVVPCRPFSVWSLLPGAGWEKGNYIAAALHQQKQMHNRQCESELRKTNIERQQINSYSFCAHKL